MFNNVVYSRIKTLFSLLLSLAAWNIIKHNCLLTQMTTDTIVYSHVISQMTKCDSSFLFNYAKNLAEEQTL